MKNGMKSGDLLPDGKRLSVCQADEKHWQIFSVQGGGYALIVSMDVHDFWVEEEYIEPGLFFEAGSGLYGMESSELISSVCMGPYPRRTAEAEAFARALQRTRRCRGDVPLAEAVFLIRFPELLPSFEQSVEMEDKRLLGSWLSGGMNFPVTDGARIKKYAPWLAADAWREILDHFGWQEEESAALGPVTQDMLQNAEKEERRPRADGPFELPGRHVLQKFLREQILDVIDRGEEYQRMGIGFPGATLLVGPPGCGKTYAVEKLAEYLGWPVHYLTAGTVGSKYLHETSQRISELFDAAQKDAPSMIIMDEMEAFLSARDMHHAGGGAHLEEMAEFLRLIPEMGRKQVLLFGMTNMPEIIDGAILRRGRFDHTVTVDLPDAEETRELLEHQLKNVPKGQRLDLSLVARRLVRRPVSDIVFAAREAGRMAVISGKTEIDEDLLNAACDELDRQGSAQKEKRRIGFGAFI